MKYKIGDKVRIASLEVLNRNPETNPEGYMNKYCGQIAEVIWITEDGNYKLDIDKEDNLGEGWFWDDSMLEDVCNKETNGKFDLTNHLRTKLDPLCAFSDQRLSDAYISTLIVGLDSAFPFRKKPKNKHSVNLIGEHKFLTLKVRS